MKFKTPYDGEAEIDPSKVSAIYDAEIPYTGKLVVVVVEGIAIDLDKSERDRAFSIGKLRGDP